jgi:hypothetical protein
MISKNRLRNVIRANAALKQCHGAIIQHQRKKINFHKSSDENKMALQTFLFSSVANRTGVDLIKLFFAINLLTPCGKLDLFIAMQFVLLMFKNL